ncbi:DNA topoisomerase III, partial [Pseudomonas aeruginosa]
ALMSQSYSTKMNIFNNQKVSDHHAIIPTEIRPDLSQLSNREMKIYMLIVERFLESLMPPYEYQHIKVHLVVGQFKFVLNENVTTQLGFKALKQQKTEIVTQN